MNTVYHIQPVRNEYPGSQQFGHLLGFNVYRYSRLCKFHPLQMVHIMLTTYDFTPEQAAEVLDLLAKEQARQINANPDLYTVEPGRHIYRNGRPFFYLGRPDGTPAAEVDCIAHVIATALNQRQPGPDDRS